MAVGPLVEIQNSHKTGSRKHTKTHTHTLTSHPFTPRAKLRGFILRERRDFCSPVSGCLRMYRAKGPGGLGTQDLSLLTFTWQSVSALGGGVKESVK